MLCVGLPQKGDRAGAAAAPCLLCPKHHLSSSTQHMNTVSIDVETLETLGTLETLETLESLESLESLETLETLEVA
jgi:hypothetical protein